MPGCCTVGMTWWPRSISLILSAQKLPPRSSLPLRSSAASVPGPQNAPLPASALVSWLHGSMALRTRPPSDSQVSLEFHRRNLARPSSNSASPDIKPPPTGARLSVLLLEPVMTCRLRLEFCCLRAPSPAFGPGRLSVLPSPELRAHQSEPVFQLTLSFGNPINNWSSDCALLSIGLH